MAPQVRLLIQPASLPCRSSSSSNSGPSSSREESAQTTLLQPHNKQTRRLLQHPRHDRHIHGPNANSFCPHPSHFQNQAYPRPQRPRPRRFQDTAMPCPRQQLLPESSSSSEVWFVSKYGTMSILSLPENHPQPCCKRPAKFLLPELDTPALLLEVS